MPARTAGWTLIELMVALLILAILATFALPAYRSHALRAHRVEATSALLELAAAQERFYLHHDRYASHTELAAAPPQGLGLAQMTRNGRYRLTIDVADTRVFSASAAASGDQAADERCSTLAIDAYGSRTATSAAGIAAARCWD
jgi:type IV pilus assembly protein PilE